MGNPKARMQQHFNEVQKLVKIGKKSNSQAKHFATQFHDTNNLQHHLARQPNLCSQNCQQASCATCRRDSCTFHHERLSADEAQSWTMQRH